MPSIAFHVARALLPLQAAREEMQYRLMQAGVPCLLAGTDITELPGWIGTAEYCYKSRWWEMLQYGGPAALADLLVEAEHWARKEWDD